MEHLSTAVRFVTDNLQSIIRQFIETEGNERRVRLEKTITPVIPGVTLVLGCSMLERNIMDMMRRVKDSGKPIDPSIPDSGKINEWQRYLDLDAKWYGWAELGNFFRLRHCFAHEFGRLTKRQEKGINDFIRSLQSCNVLDRDNQPVKGYIHINGDDILLTENWMNRFRIILADFFKLLDAKGLLIFEK